MRNTATFLSCALALGLGLAHNATLAAQPDWDKVSSTKLFVFHPGATPWEWIDAKGSHGGSRGLARGEACIGCHLEANELNLDMTRLATELEPAGAPKTMMYPVNVQAAYDSDNLYMRLTFKAPAGGFNKGDQHNELKATVLLADPDVPKGNQVGCWASCHQDSRTMPKAASAEKTKYVTTGSYQLMQWASQNNTVSDGRVSKDRQMNGGNTNVKAEANRQGDTTTITFTRNNPGEGKTISMGIAIHADHASGRFHHVSLGYLLGIGADGDIKAQKSSR